MRARARVRANLKVSDKTGVQPIYFVSIFQIIPCINILGLWWRFVLIF